MEQEHKYWFEKAVKYFRENIEDLIRRYPGRYIMIHEEGVVDSDLDDFRLAARNEKRVRLVFKHMAPILYVPESMEKYLANIERRKKSTHIPRMDSVLSPDPVQQLRKVSK